MTAGVDTVRDDLRCILEQINGGDPVILRDELPAAIEADIKALESRSSGLLSFGKAPLAIGTLAVAVGVGFYAVSRLAGPELGLNAIHVPSEVLNLFSDSGTELSSMVSSPFQDASQALLNVLSSDGAKALGYITIVVALGQAILSQSILTLVLGVTLGATMLYGPGLVATIIATEPAGVSERAAFMTAVKAQDLSAMQTILKGKEAPGHLKDYVLLQAEHIHDQASEPRTNASAQNAFRRSVESLDLAVQEGHLKGADGHALYVLEHRAFGRSESVVAREYQAAKEDRIRWYARGAEVAFRVGSASALLGGVLIGVGTLLKRRLMRIGQLAGWRNA